MNYIHVILLKKSSKNSLLTFLELFFLLELLEMPGYFHSLLFVHFVQNKIYKQKKNSCAKGKHRFAKFAGNF